jgi:hypothetical protein
MTGRKIGERTHGMCGSAEYATWCGMLRRCRNKNERAYRHYGGRGIIVCDRWLDFANFYADMGPKPSKDHSIDRINNDGNYEPGNCRWATWSQQAKNKRCRKFLFRGQMLSLSAIAEMVGLPRILVRDRINRGWTVEEATSIPPLQHTAMSYLHGPLKKAYKEARGG